MTKQNRARLPGLTPELTVVENVDRVFGDKLISECILLQNAGQQYVEQSFMGLPPQYGEMSPFACNQEAIGGSLQPQKSFIHQSKVTTCK